MCLMASSIHAPTSTFLYSVGSCGADLSESRLQLESDHHVVFEFAPVQIRGRGVTEARRRGRVTTGSSLAGSCLMHPKESLSEVLELLVP